MSGWNQRFEIVKLEKSEGKYNEWLFEYVVKAHNLQFFACEFRLQTLFHRKISVVEFQCKKILHLPTKIPTVTFWYHSWFPFCLSWKLGCRGWKLKVSEPVKRRFSTCTHMHTHTCICSGVHTGYKIALYPLGFIIHHILVLHIIKAPFFLTFFGKHGYRNILFIGKLCIGTTFDHWWFQFLNSPYRCSALPQPMDGTNIYYYNYWWKK